MEEEEQEYNINLPKQYSLNKFEVYNKRIRLWFIGIWVCTIERQGMEIFD